MKSERPPTFTFIPEDDLPPTTAQRVVIAFEHGFEVALLFGFAIVFWGLIVYLALTAIP
jgi:hypothetical protein